MGAVGDFPSVCTHYDPFCSSTLRVIHRLWSFPFLFFVSRVSFELPRQWVVRRPPPSWTPSPAPPPAMPTPLAAAAAAKAPVGRYQQSIGSFLGEGNSGEGTPMNSEMNSERRGRQGEGGRRPGEHDFLNRGLIRTDLNLLFELQNTCSDTLCSRVKMGKRFCVVDAWLCKVPFFGMRGWCLDA